MTDHAAIDLIRVNHAFNRLSRLLFAIFTTLDLALSGEVLLFGILRCSGLCLSDYVLIEFDLLFQRNSHLMFIVLRH
jgi:hypothetical protein